MNTIEFRKLAYILYTADEDDIVKVAGPVSGLKRVLRRFLNGLFSEESKSFQENNYKLTGVIKDLYSSLKDLEDAIKDYDLYAYKRLIQEVKNRVKVLNELLSKVQSNVSQLENEAKDEIKERYNIKHTGWGTTVLDQSSDQSPKTDSTAQNNTTVSTEETTSKKTDGTKETQNNINKSNENISSSLISDTEQLISELQPQSVSPSETMDDDVLKNSSKDNVEEFMYGLPESFKASILSTKSGFSISENDLKKIESKLSLKGDASSLGLDIIDAIIDFAEVNKWKEPVNKSLPYGRVGNVKINLDKNYLQDPIELSAKLAFNKKTKTIDIIEVKLVKNLKKADWLDLSLSIRKTASQLGNNFWVKFNAMAQRLGMKPEVLIPIMMIESGFKPSASNGNGGAAGLIQLMPDNLRGIGFNGSTQDFGKLTGEEQLDYIEKFISSISKSFHNGDAFNDPALYYVSNFIPDALNYHKYYDKYKGQPGWWPEGSFKDVRSGDPDAIILEKNPQFQKSPNIPIDKEKLYYNSNPYLDADKDGKITLGDLQRRIDNVKKTSQYAQLINNLQNAENYKQVDDGKEYALSEKQPKSNDESSGAIKKILDVLSLNDVSSGPDFLKDLTDKLDPLLNQSYASKENSVIKIFGNDKIINNEFVKTAELILSEGYGIIPEVFAKDNIFEIKISKSSLEEGQINLLCSSIAEKLNSSSVRWYVKPGSESLPELSLERQKRLSRMFALKKLKG